MRQRCRLRVNAFRAQRGCARAPGRNEDRSAGVNRRKRRALRTIMEEAMGILNGAIRMPLQGRQFLWRWLAPIVIILRETSARGDVQTCKKRRPECVQWWRGPQGFQVL